MCRNKAYLSCAQSCLLIFNNWFIHGSVRSWVWTQFPNTKLKALTSTFLNHVFLKFTNICLPCVMLTTIYWSSFMDIPTNIYPNMGTIKWYTVSWHKQQIPIYGHNQLIHFQLTYQPTDTQIWAQSIDTILVVINNWYPNMGTINWYTFSCYNQLIPKYGHNQLIHF